eukprot:IDg18212t1
MQRRCAALRAESECRIAHWRAAINHRWAHACTCGISSISNHRQNMMHVLAPRPPAPSVAPERVPSSTDARRVNIDSRASLETSVGGKSVSSMGAIDNTRSNELPNSVRGAPPELRRAIRKRQNSESARRCRQRRKIAQQKDDSLSVAHVARLRRLETFIVDLAARLHRTHLAITALAAHTQLPNVPHLPRQMQQHHPQIHPYNEHSSAHSELTHQPTPSGCAQSSPPHHSLQKLEMSYEMPLSPLGGSPAPLRLGPAAHRYADEASAFATTVDELARD